MFRIYQNLIDRNDDVCWYAVLDGAGVANLIDKLYGAENLHFECLLSGTLNPDMAEVAPYIVKLDEIEIFDEWVASGYGKAWGILLSAPAGMHISKVRRHLRKFNMVTGPDYRPLYFRWYDPRVIRVVLPVLENHQLEELFGPLLSMIVEVPEVNLLHVYSYINGKLIKLEKQLS